MPLWMFETATLLAMLADAIAVANGKSPDARAHALDVVKAIDAELISRNYQG